MSRKKPNKQNLTDKRAERDRQKQQKTRKKLVVTGIVLGVLALIGACAAIIYSCATAVDRAKLESLREWDWYPLSAKDSSGDQADLHDVYDVNYDSYQGVLTFFSDGSFTFWLSPGDSSDGTHSGTYSLNSDGTIDIFFDDGTYTTFTVEFDGTTAGSLTLNYNDYSIVFSQHPYEIRLTQLCASEWKAQSASISSGTASGDTVEISEAPSLPCSSVLFADDGTCTVTLTSGETKSAEYSYNQYDEITVTLPDESSFTLNAEFDGENILSVYYADEDCTVTFSQ